jgi:hypothetical protein
VREAPSRTRIAAAPALPVCKPARQLLLPRMRPRDRARQIVYGTKNRLNGEGNAMAAFKHGTMDIRTHEKTFAGFMKFVERTVIFIVVLLVFLAVFAA